MKFIYFYSPSYSFYREHITENLNKTFELVPILIEDIREQKTGHHFDGLTIKIELVIENIKNNLNNIIIFSDATIFVNKNNVKKLKDYIYILGNSHDLLFIKENIICNIGLITGGSEEL